MMKVATAAVLAGLFWFLFLRSAPQPRLEPRSASDCAAGEGRRITTSLITVCLPPDAYAYTRPGTPTGRGNIVDFWIPGLPEPLTVADESDLTGFASDPLSDRNSVCGGYPVVDKRWKRNDGRMARRISAAHTVVGYNWTTEAASVNLDKLLDTWSCR